MGFVITFDDITELVAAQRKAAWSDVARRIAHEIKNPLTPIQLAAERLRRKYMSEIKSDPETFSNCTDTIIRQVGDIGRMVDEFSAFARMPRPEMESANLGRICREAMVLPRSAHPEITFVSEIPNDPVMVSGDLRQLSQVLTNLLQNAVDAIDGRIADGEEKLPEGNIRFALSVIEDDAEIEITDNGKGLPIEKRDRLTEPYITTRTKGTGLGLAIVKTILEDHGAILELKDRDDGEPGASIRVTIPLLQADDQASLISSEDVPRKEPEGGVAYGS
jgi:two-component system nitrogen regulation sensor histidine kinase NtrY